MTTAKRPLIGGLYGVTAEPPAAAVELAMSVYTPLSQGKAVFREGTDCAARVVPNQPLTSHAADAGAIPLKRNGGACSLQSCEIASFAGGAAMRLRYIIAVTVAALAVSYHHQDTRFAVLVIFCTCILFALRRVDYQLNEVKGRINVLSNPSQLSARDILLQSAISPSRQLIEASSLLLDAGPPWEFYHEGALVMKREVNGCWQYRDATPEERQEFLRRELWSLRANQRRS